MNPDHHAPRSAIPRGLIIATAVGAIWRCAVLVFDKWDQPLLLNDSLYYSAQASQLANGVFFREIFVDQPGAEHGPLTALLLASVSWLEHPQPWQRTITMLCGVATIAVIGLLAGRIAGRRAAITAGWLAAVYPNLWMNDGLVMSESISVLLVSLFLLAAHRLLTAVGLLTAIGPVRWQRAAIVGLLAGLATLARSELALLAPVTALLIIVVHRRSGDAAALRWRSAVLQPALVIGVAVLTVSPWVAFNLARFERPVTLTTNDGTTLLGSYCDPTFYGDEIGGWSLFCVVDDDPRYGMDEEPSLRSQRQRSQAVEYAKANVTRLPVVVAARVGRTLDVYGLDRLVAQDVGEERYRWASWAGIVMWWGLAVAALFGVTSVGRRDRWLLAIPVVAVLVTTVVFYGAHRIRSSMEPTVVVLAAVGFVAMWTRRTPGATAER